MIEDKHTPPSEPADWCVFTQTRAGLVSLIKGLTEGQARMTARLATPRNRWPRKWEPSDMDGGDCSFSDYLSPDEIITVEAFRGTGETQNIWEGYRP